jgi:hypothetical protein
MRLSRLRLLSDHEQASGFVLLTCFDGTREIEISISRLDIREAGWAGLSHIGQNALVLRNLKLLAPIIREKYSNGDLEPRDHKQPLLRLTRDDLKACLPRFSADELIRTRAQQIWENEGRAEGRAAEHWARATAEIQGTHLGISSPIEPETLASIVRQRPAAYRFTARGKKVDVLDETSATLEPTFALATQQELVKKLRQLLDRLRGSNSAQRLNDTAQRMLDAADVDFSDLRPGVLLSCARSLEGDRAAFDNDDARREILPDVFAMMDDTTETARDLLAAFPIVRLIEAERVALDLDHRPHVISSIEQQLGVIKGSAERSGVVTDSAINALAQNDAAIHVAADSQKTRLVADSVLVVSNFIRAVAIRAGPELNVLAEKSWEAFKEGLPKGITVAAAVGPPLALAFWIAGPIGSLAVIMPILKPLANVVKSIIDGSYHHTVPSGGGASKEPLGERTEKTKAELKKDEGRAKRDCFDRNREKGNSRNHPSNHLLIP